MGNACCGSKNVKNVEEPEKVEKKNPEEEKRLAEKKKEESKEDKIIKSSVEEMEKLEKEKAEREAKEKAEKEAKEKAEKEAKEKAEKEAKEKAEKEKALTDGTAAIKAIGENGYFGLKKIEKFILNWEFFDKVFAGHLNVIVLDYDDQDETKELIITQTLKDQEKLESKRLDKEKSKAFYETREISVLDKVALLEEEMKCAVLPVFIPGTQKLFKLIVVVLPSGEITKINTEIMKGILMKDFLAAFGIVYLSVAIRSKFFALSKECITWLNQKCTFDCIQIGIFFTTKEENDSIIWVAGNNENNFSFSKDLKGVLEKEKVETDDFVAFKIDPNVEVNGKKVFGCIRIDSKDKVDLDLDEVTHSIKILEKCIRKISKEEEVADVDEDIEEKDEEEEKKEGEEELEDDDGEVSDDEDEESPHGEKKVFFEAMVRSISRKIRALKRADAAEVISFKSPPQGVFEVNKATLFLLGVSRKSVNEWDRARKIMKTKYKNKFKALKAIGVNAIKKSRRKKATEMMKDITFKEIKEINLATSLLYAFNSLCISYGLSNEKESDGEFKDIFAHFKLLE